MKMKKRMSSVDMAASVEELKCLEGARIEKSYQLTEDEILIKMYHYDHGKLNLIIEAGKRIHLTDYPRSAPERPPDFPMVMRKHTQGGTLENINQFNFDRIVEIEINRGEKTVFLVAELFGEGNVVLCREEEEKSEIILPLRWTRFKDRSIEPGRVYTYPPSRKNPLELSFEEFEKTITSSEKDLVRTLATSMNIGGTYAEEICIRAEMDKEIKPCDMNSQDIEKIYYVFDNLFEPLKNRNISPQIVKDESGEMVDVVPFELELYKKKGRETEEYETFNEALDAFFTSKEMDMLEDKRDNKFKEKLNRLKARKKGQLSTAKKYKEGYKKGIEKGDLIYLHFQEVKNILDTINEARDNYSWGEIKEKIESGKEKGIKHAESVKEIDENNGIVKIELDGYEIPLDIRTSVEKNAERIYEKAKKLKKKSKGAVKAADETEKLIEDLKEEGKESFEAREPPQRKVRRKEFWYDKFRWFKTFDKFLVIAGRNADQNEEIVKNHMNSNDLFYHTDMEGAPATVLKVEGEEKIPSTTLEEAAQFAASISSAWKKFYSADVYCVSGNQVTKTPESGEYIGKGSFVIRGDRKYYRNVELKHAVGIEIDKYTRLIAGPPSAVSHHSKYYVKLKPGDKCRSEVAEKISAYFKDIADQADQKIVSTLTKSDDIERLFPPGNLKIIDMLKNDN